MPLAFSPTTERLAKDHISLKGDHQALGGIHDVNIDVSHITGLRCGPDIAINQLARFNGASEWQTINYDCA